jgi:sec-independent protein translocase protein TatB
MFDIFSWQHIIILLGVALIVVGPKDLPRMMNMAGKWAGKARAMANEFRKSFDEMARQSELDELRKEIDDLKKNNPLTDLAGHVNEMQATLNNPVAAMMQSPAEAAAPLETAPLETGPEPRSGELAVTDAPHDTQAADAASPSTAPTP